MAKRRSEKPVRLQKLGMRDVTIFRIANRRGYAAMARE